MTTTTEVEQVQQPASAPLALPAPAMGPGTDLEAWVNDMQWAIALATPMCKTPFVPKAFFNKPEDTAIAIMYGKGLGLDPFASLSSVFVIGGRPGMYARDQHSLLLAHGHQVEVVRQSPEECTVRGRRKGTETWTTATWTPERAKQAGYYSNDKYKTDPIAMLTARALGDVCRLVAPDVLKGIASYNESDVELMQQDVIDGDTLEPLQPAQAKKARTFQRAARSSEAAVPLTVVPPAPEQAAPEQTAETIAQALAAPATPDGSAPCNTHQQAELSHQLDRAGKRTKAAKLAHVREWAGRELPNATALTADEADRLINELMFANDNPATEPEPAPEPTTNDAESVDATWGLPAPEGH